MHEYDVRKGRYDNVKPENLRKTMSDIFGNVEEREGKFSSKYGALDPILAWPGSSKKTLCVETTMNPGVDNETAQSTIKAYNSFLEAVTGYNAKERGKRAQKAAKEGKT